MLYSCTQKSYSPFDNRLLLFVLLQCLLINFFSDFLDVYKCVLALVCITGICQAYYIISLVWELTQVLNIHCFSIKKKTTSEECLLM